MGLKTKNRHNYENMTINDLISDYIIYKIENPNFDFLKSKNIGKYLMVKMLTRKLAYYKSEKIYR